MTRVPWLARLRVLAGLPVCLEIEGEGQFADISDLAGLTGPDDLTGPDGPWRDPA